MYRTAASRLRVLKSHVGNLGAARYATLSAVAARPSSLEFISWLTGELSSSLSPLDSPLEGVSFPPPLPDYVQPSQIKFKTLPNGVKIASEASPNTACKSTKNRSHLHIVREVKAIGGNTSASASREQMLCTFDALKTYVPEMVELLINCVRNPAFLDWEANEEKVKAELVELSNKPRGLVLDAIHAAGYSGALANPLLAPDSALNSLDGTILEEFVEVRSRKSVNTAYMFFRPNMYHIMN